MRLSTARWGLAFFAALMVGCSGGEAARYPVEGVILLNGKPYPSVTVDFVPDPGNAAIAAGSDVTGPEGNYRITTLGKPGLPVGKYKVVVTPKVSEEELAAEKAIYEDEEQRRMALESLGGAARRKAAKKEEKPGGEFETQVEATTNTLEFDVKAKADK